MLEKNILKTANNLFTEYNSEIGCLNGMMELEEKCFHINDPSVFG